ncbi:hypothetical protein, partial [Escherichia coli]|uniref:hypothetical protein n=1 Tax=Escherichia coli TaxID=562 RepID=UPI00307A44C0
MKLVLLVQLVLLVLVVPLVIVVRLVHLDLLALLDPLVLMANLEIRESRVNQDRKVIQEPLDPKDHQVLQAQWAQLVSQD